MNPTDLKIDGNRLLGRINELGQIGRMPMAC